MSTSQGQEHGFLEDQHIVQSPVSPVLQTYLSPSSARSSEVGQRRQYLRSPMIPIVRSPGFRLYLSPSFARPTDTRRRVSPSIPVGSHTSVDIPASAHTSVDIPAGAHTLVGLPRKSGKRKLRSDIWEDFNAIYDEEGRLMQGQCIHCDNIFPSTKKSGSSQCRRHRMKIQECNKGQIYDIGFVDCNFVHEVTLKTNPKETEDNLFQALKYFSNKREILFPYNAGVSSFHYILLIIALDTGVVKVMDSKRTPLEKWTDMQECFQKVWKRFTAKTRGVWKPELTFQPLTKLGITYVDTISASSFAKRPKRRGQTGTSKKLKSNGCGTVFYHKNACKQFKRKLPDSC